MKGVCAQHTNNFQEVLLRKCISFYTINVTIFQFNPFLQPLARRAAPGVRRRVARQPGVRRAALP